MADLLTVLSRAEPGALIFAGIGAVSTVGALVAAIRKRARLSTWTRVVGTVTGHRLRRSRRDGRTRTFHHPIIAFDARGEQRFYDSPIGTGTPGPVGEQVPIVFNPDDIEDACVDTFRDRYFVMLVIGGIGVVFSGVGIWGVLHG